MLASLFREDEQVDSAKVAECRNPDAPTGVGASCPKVRRLSQFAALVQSRPLQSGSHQAR